MIQFTYSGFQCLTRRTAMGIACGYVGLPRSHPYHGKRYDAINDIEIHGGLTFSGYGKGWNDGLWYLGFDCGHAFDLDDLPTSLTIPPYVLKSNKSNEFVMEQTKRLAEQLANLVRTS